MDIGEDIYNYEGFYEKFTYQICWDLRLDKLSKFLTKITIYAEDVESKHST